MDGKRTTLQIPTPLHERLRALAGWHRRSVHAEILWLIGRAADEQEAQMTGVLEARETKQADFRTVLAKFGIEHDESDIYEVQVTRLADRHGLAFYRVEVWDPSSQVPQVHEVELETAI